MITFETLSHVSSSAVSFSRTAVICFIALLAVQNEPVGVARSQGQEGSAQDRFVLTPPPKSNDESASVTPRSTHGHVDETKGKRWVHCRVHGIFTVLYMYT